MSVQTLCLRDRLAIRRQQVSANPSIPELLRPIPALPARAQQARVATASACHFAVNPDPQQNPAWKYFQAPEYAGSSPGFLLVAILTCANRSFDLIFAHRRSLRKDRSRNRSRLSVPSIKTRLEAAVTVTRQFVFENSSTASGWQESAVFRISGSSFPRKREPRLWFVMPAQAGIQTGEPDSRLRGNDAQPQFQVLTKHDPFVLSFH